MKNIILLLCSGIVFAQTPQIIKLKEYYKGEGVILHKNIHYPFEKLNYKEGYTPTIKDIKKTEQYFFANYYDYEATTLDCLKMYKSKQRLNLKLKKSLFVKKKYYKYNRQYAGYISKSNDTIIYLGLLDFADKKRAIEYFEGWQKNFTSLSGIDIRQEIFYYNLTKNKYILNVSN